jgi:thiosulfate dehydrogenase
VSKKTLASRLGLDARTLCIIACLAAACSSAPSESEVQRGKALWSSRDLSPSTLNLYSCATCHDADAPGATWTKPGSILAGATLRPSFWGGQENDLLRAVNACRREFMVATEPLAASEPDAVALYAYLASLQPLAPDAVPFTVVRDIEPLPRGDAGRGQSVFTQACLYCHGLMHSGSGRLDERVPILPEDTLTEHAEFSVRIQRLIFIEKIRHGLFLGYGGDMPPFSLEVLSDARVSDLLEALGVLGE